MRPCVSARPTKDPGSLAALALEADDLQGVTQALTTAFVAADLLGRQHVLDRAEDKGHDLEALQAAGSVDAFAEIDIQDGVAVIPPREAIQFFRQSQPISSVTVEKLVAAAQQRSDAVVQALIDELNGDIKRLVLEGLERGLSTTEIIDALADRFEAKGLAEVNPSRLETITRTNAQTAYNAGRVQMMQAPAVKAALPYWQYVTVGDSAVRPEHRKLDGLVMPADSPKWKDLIPPLDYNCRCTVVALDGDDLESEGLTATDGPPADFNPSDFESQAATVLDAPTAGV